MNKSGANALILVFSTVILGLISAWCLKEAAQKQDISLSMLVLVIGVVAVVNAARFIIWGYVHRRYPISVTYPLNSVFFPMILFMGYFYGEVVSFKEVFGVVLITVGVALMTYKYAHD